MKKVSSRNSAMVNTTVAKDSRNSATGSRQVLNCCAGKGVSGVNLMS